MTPGLAADPERCAVTGAALDRFFTESRALTPLMPGVINVGYGTATHACSDTPGPAELAQLEHAFATDPNSDAYRPLAEAYLKMGRFMEAMVVCKKGVKAHPEKPDARVLLASVYAAQNKDRKAIDELEGALQTAPSDGTARRMAAGLLLKAGDNDKGKDYALRAYKAN